MDHILDGHLGRQDRLITRPQALTVLSVGSLRHLLARRWRIVLPGVYAGFTGDLSDRQRKRAALLYAGELAQLADVTSLIDQQVRYVPAESAIHVLIPSAEHRASHGFVTVRRTHRLPRPRVVAGLPYCPPERALVEASARLGDLRTARAMMSDAAQRRIADLARLERELPHLSGRGSGIARTAVIDVLAGGRSAPELDFLDLCKTYSELPRPLVNPLVRLPDGRLISPDALFVDAGLVHETNGRGPHADEDPFEDMQARHDTMTTAGLVVLHNSPRQIGRDSQRVMAEVIACHRRLAGRGLPAGVTLVRESAA
jgi:hypothetical protein